MSAPTLHLLTGVLFRSDETLIAIKRAVLRARRARAITAELAADAFYGVDEIEYPDLADTIGFMLANRRALGVEWWTYIRGCVINRVPGESMLFRDALQAYVTAYRGQWGMLPGEPFPAYEPGSLAAHLQSRGWK
ncbi:hypothetical protein SAMN05414139_01466 [Burkholderia sp. D7]|nr:hypothetical protein SAMN05414139_01466 [Burkholderia sp. D7]